MILIFQLFDKTNVSLGFIELDYLYTTVYAFTRHLDEELE